MSGDNLLGRLAVHYKLISMEQLAEATRYQGQISGALRLGEIFLMNEWLGQEQLDWLLRAQDAYKQQQPAPPADSAPGPRRAAVLKPKTSSKPAAAAVNRPGGAAKPPPLPGSAARTGRGETRVDETARTVYAQVPIGESLDESSPTPVVMGTRRRPTADTSTQHRPTGDTPVQRRPTGDTPVQRRPSGETPVQRRSTADMPIQRRPAADVLQTRAQPQAQPRPAPSPQPSQSPTRGGSGPHRATQHTIPGAPVPQVISAEAAHATAQALAAAEAAKAAAEVARAASASREPEVVVVDGRRVPAWSQAGASGALDPMLSSLLRDAARRGASDIHIHEGARTRLRVNGRFVDYRNFTAAGEPLARMLAGLLGPRQRQVFGEEGEIDFAYSLEGVGRLRGNMYRQQRGLDCVLRLVPGDPPSLTDLNLPTGLARFTTFHQGMVLITGPGGCGKSSTLAALVNIINEEHTDHILTIEDPIECLHVAKRCVVNQRQVRRHTHSFARALRGALREDPDVIVVGELRDFETISLAMSAAETGHLVLGTLHTNSAMRTVDRIIGTFPPIQQGQARAMLSESLRAVVSQRLVNLRDGTGRIPAIEVMVVTRAISNLIRENKTYQIRSVLQTSTAQGMCLLEHSMNHLIQTGTITAEEARRHLDDIMRPED